MKSVFEYIKRLTCSTLRQFWVSFLSTCLVIDTVFRFYLIGIKYFYISSIKHYITELWGNTKQILQSKEHFQNKFETNSKLCETHPSHPNFSIFFNITKFPEVLSATLIKKLKVPLQLSKLRAFKSTHVVPICAVAGGFPAVPSDTALAQGRFDRPARRRRQFDRPARRRRHFAFHHLLLITK